MLFSELTLFLCGAGHPYIFQYHLRCTDITCTGFWKPYTIDGQPTASPDVQSSLQLVTRPDGSKQAAYNQQPLYTFYLDAQPGDAKGNGFADFGGTWHVVTTASTSGGSNNSSNGGGNAAPTGAPNSPYGNPY